MPSPSPVAGWHERVGRSPLATRVLRYLAGSVVATGCSQAAFLLLYGAFGAGTTVSSVLAWLAGAVPNYWLNRRWTWQRQGRASLRRELLPYVLIVAVTLLLAIGITGAVDHLVSGWDVSRVARTLLVGAAYFMTYALSFLLRFFLFDRLFRRLAGRE